MACRQIVELYDNLIEQMETNIGNKIHIKYPRGTENIIIRDFDVTLEVYSIILGRRNELAGGKEWE